MTQFEQSTRGLCRACRVYATKGDEPLCPACQALSREHVIRHARITAQLVGRPAHPRDEQP